MKKNNSNVIDKTFSPDLLSGMNFGLIQLRFDILNVIISCFVLIELCLLVYSVYFKRHSM